MKILMFGSGVIASIYGHVFSQSGIEVVHYVRPNKIEELQNGIQLQLIDARKKSNTIIQNYKPQFIDELPSFDEFDLVFVSLRHYQLQSILPMLSKKLGRADFLFFNHLWNDVSFMDKHIPRDKYIWGFPGAGGGFYHSPHLTLKGALMNNIQLGDFYGNEDILTNITNLFEHVGIKAKVHDNIQHWLWKQFALNAGISSMAMKAGGTERLISSLPHLRQAVLCIREALEICKARGVKVNEYLDAKAFYLPSWFAAMAFWFTLKTNKHQREIFKSYNHTEEIQEIYKDIMSKAAELNIKMPVLESMVDVMMETKIIVSNRIS